MSGKLELPSLHALGPTVLSTITSNITSTNDVGVFDPIPAVLDAMIYGNEGRAHNVVHVGVQQWYEGERGIGVAFVGEGDPEQQLSRMLDLAAYILANLVVRYEYDAMPRTPAVMILHGSSRHVRFRLREEHPKMQALESFPSVEALKQLLFESGATGFEGRSRGHSRFTQVNGNFSFIVNFSSPTVDPTFWKFNNEEYQNARLYAFPAKARLVTHLVEQWVRNVYAPLIEHKGIVELTQWDFQKARTGDSVLVRILADMPVVNRRSRKARMEVDRTNHTGIASANVDTTATEMSE